MNKLIFTVQGVPVAKARARSIMRGGKVWHYTPAKTRNFEELVAYQAKAAMRKAKMQMVFAVPVSLSVDFIMPIPKSWSKLRRKVAEDFLPHIMKPDGDNLLKAIKDGCNGVVWKDDSCVWTSQVRKYYGAEAKAIVIIEVDAEWWMA